MFKNIVSKIRHKGCEQDKNPGLSSAQLPVYEGWNFNSGNYLFTTDTK